MQQNQYLENVHTKSNNQINYLGGGINTAYPPQYIQDDECQDMYNLSLDKYPAIKTSKGSSPLGVRFGTHVQYVGIIEFEYTYTIDLKKEDIFVIDKYNQLYTYTGTLIDVLDQNPNSLFRYGHFCYKDGNNSYLVIYAFGIKPRRYKLPLNEYTTPEELNTPNGISFSCMCYHKNRIIGTDGSNMLYFSAIQDPNDWTTPETTAEVKVENCHEITALVSFDDKLIVFSKHNMHLFYGSSTNQSLSNAYTCVNLDNNIGCYNHNTIIIHNSFLYWIGENNDIFEYDGSIIRNITEPTSNNGISGGIKELLTGFVDDYKFFSMAASENKIFFNFIRIDNILETIHEHLLLIFDQRLRKWTKEKSVDSKAYVMIFSPKINYNYKKPIYAIEDVSGKVYIINNRDDGFNELLDTHGDVWESYTDKIKFYLKTKEFKNGTLSKKKSLTQLWFNYDLIDGTVDINIITDNGKNKCIENALPTDVKNATHCVLIPNELQNAYSYTFEISGTGYFCLYSMERIDRTDTR